MRRISDGRSETAILKNITDEFTTFRTVSSGHISKHLRELAVSALRAGVARNQVAVAAGVSPKTISNWSASSRPQAKQLSIISEPERKPSILRPAATTSTSIIIRLKSGVEVELSNQELSFEFLSLLNNLSSGRGGLVGER